MSSFTPNYRYRFIFSEGYGKWEEIYVDPRSENNIKDFFDEIENWEGPRVACRWSGFEWEKIPNVTIKKRFSVEEIKNILSELKNLNDCKLKEIELTKDGKVISISEEMLNEWSFLGLSNTSFVEMEFWKEK